MERGETKKSWTKQATPRRMMTEYLQCDRTCCEDVPIRTLHSSLTVPYVRCRYRAYADKVQRYPDTMNSSATGQPMPVGNLETKALPQFPSACKVTPISLVIIQDF